MSYPQNLDVTVPHAIAYLFSNSNFILIVKLTIVTFLEYLISKKWQLTSCDNDAKSNHFSTIEKQNFNSFSKMAF